MQKKIVVLGAGSWGTALALSCARVPNQQVYLWGHRVSHIENLQRDNENSRYLPNHTFPHNLHAVSDLSIIADCDSTPAIGWAIKGFDSETNELLHATFASRFPNTPYTVLAGPSFAKEVAISLPTAITIAGSNIEFAQHFARFVGHKTMRTYVTALITRGLREISRIGKQAGAETETLMGLSGLGDLLLTCTDNLSRNRRFGLLLGEGKSVSEALETIGQTVEGYYTATEALMYVTKYNVRSPIVLCVASIINGDLSVSEAIEELLSHTIKPETD